MFHKQHLGLQDCQTHGSQTTAELFIVEGISASQAVCNLRDVEFQAVLPMQGKPANAIKASARLLREYSLFRQLLSALGYETAEQASADTCRYGRILFLFDPDADGIHCGALMLIYFYHQLRPLLEAGRISVIRAPLFEVHYRQTLATDAPVNSRLAYTEDELRQMQRELTLAGAMNLKTKRMRGLGGMPTDLLRRTCIDPQTRHAFRLGPQDAEAAMAVFGG
ncbi:MAG: toprim domain-containing protein [Pirellulaceae bacterium]